MMVHSYKYTSTSKTPSTPQAIHACGRYWRGSGFKLSGSRCLVAPEHLRELLHAGADWRGRHSSYPLSWIQELSKALFSPRSCSTCSSMPSFGCWTPPESLTRLGTPWTGTTKPSQTTSHCVRTTLPTQTSCLGWCSSSKIEAGRRSQPRSQLQREPCTAERLEEVEQ